MTRNSVKRHHFTILESDRDNLGKKPGFMTLRNSLEDRFGGQPQMKNLS